MRVKILITFLVILLIISAYATAYHTTAHTQTSPTPVTVELKEKHIGETEFSKYGRSFGLNIYFNLHLTARGRSINLGEEKTNPYTYSYYPQWARSYKADGYNIKTDEMVCVGERLYINKFTTNGEYYQKGGPTDSPPIRFVENLDEIKKQIELHTYTTDIERMIICQWAVEDERIIGPKRCVIDGAVLCSNKCMLEIGKNLKEVGVGEYEVIGSGKVELGVSCTPECIIFVDRKEGIYEYPEREWERDMPNIVKLEPLYGYMELKDPSGKELTVKKMFLMNAGEGYGPSIEIISVHVPQNIESGSEFVIRLEIENKGDMKADFNKILLNMPDSKILYKPQTLEKGERSEILIKTKALNVGDLTLDIEYSSEHLSCLNTKDFSQTFSLGFINVKEGKSCSVSSDCSVGEICCVGSCRPSNKGICDDIDGDGEPDTWVEV